MEERREERGAGLQRSQEELDARAVIHGHAHHGQPEGRTPKGIPVFNVSQPLLRQRLGGATFRVLEI
jgi:uncharacterized protein